MALAKMCDICDHVEKVDSHNAKPRGWGRLRLEMDDQDDASKGQSVEVMSIEVCKACGAILREHVKNIVAAVMEIRTRPRSVS